MDAWEPDPWPLEPPPPLTVDAEHALLIFAGAACWLAACGAAVNGTVLRFVLPHLALLAASGCFAGCAPLTYIVLCFGAWACLALSRASPRFRRHALGVGRGGWRGRSAERRQAEADDFVGGVLTQLEQVIGETLKTRPRQLQELGPEIGRYARRACCWLWRRVEGRPGAEVALAAAGELRSAALALALYCSEEGQYPPGYLEFDRVFRLCVVITCRGVAKAHPQLACYPDSESLPHLLQAVGEKLLAGISDTLAKTALSVPSFSSSPASIQLLVFCYWLPCALGFDIVRCFLICALVFTVAHCKLLALDLGAADPPPAHAVALWLHVRRRPRRLVLSLLIAALGVPLWWMLNATVLTLVVPPVVILLYYKPELQDSVSQSVAAAIQPLVDCMPSLQELEAAAVTTRLTSCLTPFETFAVQVLAVQASDEAIFKKCLCGGLSAGLCFTVLGFLGVPCVSALLHFLLCCGLALAAEIPPDGKGQQLACKVHGVAIGLAAFVTAELAIGGYVLLLGPQVLHLEAQIRLGPWLEDLAAPWLGLTLGPMLASEASTRLGPRCRAWLGVFYEPFLGSELGKDVGLTLGSWLGVGVGAWGGHLIGGFVGALLGVWLAGPVGLLSLPLVWLVALAVWLQVQVYDPGLALRRALFDLWLRHVRSGSEARILDLGVASSAHSTAVLSATLQKLEPGHGPLLVQFSDAGEDSVPSILMRCWVGHLAEAIVGADPLPMLVKWEEGSKVYGLNYEWLPFYRSACSSSSRLVASQARLAALEASSAESFRQLGLVFGCCLLEGQCLVKTSPILFSRLAQAGEAVGSTGQGDVITQPDCGAKDVSALKELCPSIAEKLRTAASAGADPLEVQLPARLAALPDPLRVSAPGRCGSAPDRPSVLGTSATAVLENSHVAPLLSAFRSGFADAVGLPDLPELFSPLEVRRVLAGESKVDAEDWERHARYSEGFSAASPEVRLFWVVLRELPQEDLQALCKLATGLPTPPLGGFGALSPPFVLARQRDILVKMILLYTHQSVVELPRCRGGLPDMRRKVAAVISAAKVPTRGGNGRRPQ